MTHWRRSLKSNVHRPIAWQPLAWAALLNLCWPALALAQYDPQYNQLPPPYQSPPLGYQQPGYPAQQQQPIYPQPQTPTTTYRTRILSVNGVHPNQLGAGTQYGVPTIQAQPMEAIHLVVDEIYIDPYSGREIRAGMAGQNYVWSTTLNSYDTCDGAAPCQGTSFVPHQNGVTVYAPLNAQSFTITVRNRYTNLYDQIQVQMQQYFGQYPGQQPAPYPGQQPNPQYPDQLYTDPSYYPESQPFDYNIALNGMGNWVSVAGVRVFVPIFYRADWQPYQHGYWYWTQYGWTWMSYDPWGWVTDHYGYWRHHRQFGWVWTPFQPTGGRVVWRPAVVTFFNDDGHIGWSPYWDHWDAGYVGYRHGYAHGYDDGYWDGFNAGLNASYNFGYTCVPSVHFVSSNIYTVRVQRPVVVQVFSRALSGRRFGRGAVVYGTHDTARVYVQARTGRAVTVVPVETRIRRSTSGAPVAVVVPRTPPHQLPEEYRRVSDDAARRLRDPARRHVTPGTGIDRDGRLIVPPPAVVQPGRGGVVQPIQPIQPVQPVRPVQPQPDPRLQPGTGGVVQPVRPVAPVQPDPRVQPGRGAVVQPVQPDLRVQPGRVGVVQPIQPIQPVQPVRPVQPQPDPRLQPGRGGFSPPAQQPPTQVRPDPRFQQPPTLRQPDPRFQQPPTLRQPDPRIQPGSGGFTPPPMQRQPDLRVQPGRGGTVVQQLSQGIVGGGAGGGSRSVVVRPR